MFKKDFLIKILIVFATQIFIILPFGFVSTFAQSFVSFFIRQINVKRIGVTENGEQCKYSRPCKYRPSSFACVQFAIRNNIEKVKVALSITRFDFQQPNI